MGTKQVGWDHALRPGEAKKYASGISAKDAEKLLASDLAWAEGAVDEDVTVALSQNQFDALVDFTYNEGGARFAGSTLLTHVNGQGASETDFTIYDRDGAPLRSDPALLDRRRDEWMIYSTGKYPGGGN